MHIMKITLQIRQLIEYNHEIEIETESMEELELKLEKIENKRGGEDLEDYIYLLKWRE